ncbi:hypothetical protein [Shewanella sp.]|jgi:2-oxoglutarate dehydrogenase complex dehydrogenase (E1) component-like enzyme|uniref:hypothetical protein n=1 Tax=Shewanella sp. TaxID=50422 RepID=UPI0040475D77
MLKNWPSDYPEHLEIPPETANEKTADLYRLVENNPPIEEDFNASYKDPAQAHLIKKHANLPKFYGTSMFAERHAINNLIDSNPNRFRKKIVAFGEVKPEHGKMSDKSGSDHVTVWFYENVFPKGFRVV